MWYIQNVFNIFIIYLSGMHTVFLRKVLGVRGFHLKRVNAEERNGYQIMQMLMGMKLKIL